MTTTTHAPKPWGANHTQPCPFPLEFNGRIIIDEQLRVQSPAQRPYRHACLRSRLGAGLPQIHIRRICRSPGEQGSKARIGEGESMTFSEQRALDLAFTRQIAAELRRRFLLARIAHVMWRGA